jgi:lipopolysaccharide transport system ATP-binding protein
LGLIGHNGAGKTTLLKMLNGLIKPDAGSITMRGRVGALIALGAGFNPILTGRAGLWTLDSASPSMAPSWGSKKGTGTPGGAEEGCRRRARRASRFGRNANQIDAKIDEIIDFAEIREFIDMPVQSYSSGMAERFKTQKVLIS